MRNNELLTAPEWVLITTATSPLPIPRLDYLKQIPSHPLVPDSPSSFAAPPLSTTTRQIAFMPSVIWKFRTLDKEALTTDSEV